ncbi:hypothetical protein [Pararhizobium sp.]|uniref:hypothetical protein n=1 Tax=Pararhizobium sp. TaxID=1977563 RepID=UPI002724C460|nr:hypothetical protein [Pararhizobium sp.]MDO9416463.1 hypothetical protein [Pararhizobium sp.]
MKIPSLLTLMILLSAATLPPAAAMAEDGRSPSLDFNSLSADKAFKDLPGVKHHEDNVPQRDFTCTTSFDDGDEIFPGPDRLGSNLVYTCTDGLVTLESKTPPRSLEREKRGLNW